VRERALARLLERLNLRFPGLFLLFATLAAIDLVIPDLIPFVDEIGLTLLAAMFGLWRRRRAPPAELHRR
jgi:hypothetical protein